MLKSENVPATFFLVCQNVNTANISQYQDPLFTVGMHTYRHGDYRKLDAAEIKNDIRQCIQTFHDLNLPTTYFRPAYGITNLTEVEELSDAGVKGILWNIDSHDWNGYTGDVLYDHVLNNLSGGSIILFHDKFEVNTVRALIQKIRAHNFEIVPLASILEFEKEYP